MSRSTDAQRRGGLLPGLHRHRRRQAMAIRCRRDWEGAAHYWHTTKNIHKPEPFCVPNHRCNLKPFRPTSGSNRHSQACSRSPRGSLSARDCARKRGHEAQLHVVRLEHLVLVLGPYRHQARHVDRRCGILPLFEVFSPARGVWLGLSYFLVGWGSSGTICYAASAPRSRPFVYCKLECNVILMVMYTFLPLHTHLLP